MCQKSHLIRSTLLVISTLALAACSASDPSADTAAPSDPTLAAAQVDAPVAPPSAPADGALAPSGSAPAPASDPAPASAPPAPSDPTTTPPATPSDPPAPAPNPNPKPTATWSFTKDANGFFTRNAPGATYVAYVPAGYTGNEPMPVLVGLHGCGDNAMNFATWAVAPWDTRATQKYIGISIDGSTANGGRCWTMGGDDDKVLAALDDLQSRFWIDRAKVVIGGFSSGGQLAYRVGLMHADRFSGIAIECSGLYAAGADEDTLLANAARKIPIAHRAHTSDTVFPLAQVQADWTKTQAAGFSITTSETAGGHDGSSADWTGFLLPQMAAWWGQ